MLLYFFISNPASAQRSRNEILQDIHNMSGIYSPYPDTGYLQSPAPEGYKPFYISHIGRHGSRWHSSDTNYRRTLEKLEQGEAEKKLTSTGTEVLRLVKTMADDAKDRYGELTPRGTREHRHIAERMYYNFPEVFSTANGKICKIEAYSSNVVRCVLSMAASNERLKELNPEIQIERSSSMRNMEKIFGRPQCFKIGEEISKEKSAAYRKYSDSDRLLKTLFTDYSFIPENKRWETLYDLYMLASICSDVDYLGIDLFKYLIPEEIFGIWALRNAAMYLQSGPSERFGKRALSDAKPSLRHILECADKAVQNGNISATLRYGHDQNIVPLSALMCIEECDNSVSDMKKVHESWCDFVITPMACNIQMIFFRNENQDDIIVKILFNEKEVRLSGLQSDIFPFYKWSDLRSFLYGKLE